MTPLNEAQPVPDETVWNALLKKGRPLYRADDR